MVDAADMDNCTDHHEGEPCSTKPDLHGAMCNCNCDHCIDVRGEDWEDPDVTMRKQILEEVMERHPDFAFTGDSVQRYIESGDELESAGNDYYLSGEY